MKNQSLILLMVAVGCGLVAMLGVRQVINSKPVEEVETIPVLSATADIQPGVPLDDSNTKLIATPITSVPENAVTSLQEIDQRYLKVSVVAGDWILKTKLTEKGQRGVEAILPPGMGIVTIPVDATTSHSGMLQPGNRIDLLLTFDDSKDGRRSQKTMTVLEFVEVLAVDNRVYGADQGGEGQAKNITLLVTPEQGKAVTLAGKIGTLSTMMVSRVGSKATGKAAISDEWLTSSFMGSNRDAPSVMDARETDSDLSAAVTSHEPAAPVTPGNISTSIDELLALETGRTAPVNRNDPGGSGPVPPAPSLTAEPVPNWTAEDVWKMEIYEKDSVRVESVRVASSETGKSSDKSDWSVWNLFKSN